MQQVTIFDSANVPSTLRTNLEAERTRSSAVGEGINGGDYLPKLSIRGKDFSIAMNGSSKPLDSHVLPVIIVDARPYVSKELYTKVYDPNATKSIPDCASINGQGPDFPTSVIDPETKQCPHNCATCFFNRFGTANQGGGKACKDYKRLIVIIAGTEDRPFNPSLPALILDVPATSLRAPRGSSAMMLKEFTEICSRNQMPVSGVVANLSFMPGVAYPQLVMAPARYVTDEEYKRVLACREEPAVKHALEDKVEPAAEQTDLAEGQNEPIAEQAPATIQGERPNIAGLEAQAKAAPAAAKAEPAKQAKPATNTDIEPEFNFDVPVTGQPAKVEVPQVAAYAEAQPAPAVEEPATVATAGDEQSVQAALDSLLSSLD